jgi:hypothetical protein
MSQPNSPKSSPQTSLESASQTSNEPGANECWDQSIRIDRPELLLNGHQNHASDIEVMDGSNMGTKGKKSLGEMLRRHVERGRSLNLSDEEEENLSEELGKWVSTGVLLNDRFTHCP